jgi:hypothetical protein
MPPCLPNTGSDSPPVARVYSRGVKEGKPYAAPNFAFTTSLTSLGLALPPIAFIV